MNSLPQLNVVKCILSVRKSKTERFDVYFYEILSPAGVVSFKTLLSPNGEDSDRGAIVRSESVNFLLYAEQLLEDGALEEPPIPSNKLEELEMLLIEVLAPGEARQVLDREDSYIKTLEESVRREILARLGYRVTAYLHVERCDPESLAPFIREAGADAPGEPGSTEQLSFLVPCAPVIDPVKGTPVASLNQGDLVLLRLPEDETAPVREKLQRADPAFDGIVKGEVVSVHQDRHGGFTLLVHLSDEFKGVVSLEGNSRLRTEAASKKALTLADATKPAEKAEEHAPSAATIAQSSEGDPAWLYGLVLGSMVALIAILLLLRFIG